MRQQFKLFIISKLTFHKQFKMSVCYSGKYARLAVRHVRVFK